MITVRIKQEFHDRDNFSKVYPVGSVCEFDNGRAEELISKGLAEKVVNECTENRPKKARKVFDE